MNTNLEGVMGLDRLKDHYKHCIRLSTSNKINPKNAFDLQLIDYMQDLVSSSEDGQMNFKIASSALDVGAKIYSSRVDCIQSEAQKVASSILMALDGQKHDGGKSLDDTHTNNDTSAMSDRLDDSADGEEGAQGKPTKRKTRKNVKTVVEDENLIDAKLEKMVLGDPYLDGLSQDYDMSCPAALICYNALTQPSCLLTIESNNIRKNYQDKLTNTSPTKNFNFVTLITKSVNCAQIIRNNQGNQICTRLQNFLFNDRTTTISGLNTNTDESFASLPSIDTSKPVGGAHEFNPELYDNNIGNDDYSDGNDSEAGNNPENDLIPNLDKIAATKPSDYAYSNEHHRLLNTWAGPHAWKVAKPPQTAKKDGAPKSARKRIKLEQKPIDYSEDILSSLEEIADKEIRHSADVIRRWKKPLLPQDHNFTEDLIRTTLIHTFMRPEDTYHCMKTPADALKLVDIDHDYTKNDRNGSMDEAPHSPMMGGFDDVHDDSDDEFRADPVVEGNEVAIYGATVDNSLNQQADLDFAGEHLIEQPYTVAQVVIPFAKIAKKMDVRKLKHVMWELLLPPENRVENSGQENNVTVIENVSNNVSGDQTTIIEPSKKTPSPSPSESEVHLAFSNLYGELPVRVSSKMANDLSQPIAFVTLLHLANEKNLKLIPNQDLKDFIIEQDELV